MDDLLKVMGLVLIVEALMPFISPRLYRSTAAQLSLMADRQVRLVGLALLLIGTVLVWAS